ncbi:MAG: hypothetical protein GY841_18145 [FCB group bacterium]|nr:hypothetical protein [FCB group bacterium]
MASELQIIPFDLWDAVNHRNNRKPRTLLGVSNKGSYLLTGLLHCASCGSAMVVNNSGKYSAYMCNGYRSGGKSVCCNNHRILRSKIESEVVGNIRNAVNNPVMLQTVYDKFKKSVSGYLDKYNAQANGLVKLREELKREIANLADYVQAGDGSSTVRSRLESKECELSEIELRIASSRTSIDKIMDVSPNEVSSMIIGMLDKLSERNTDTREVNNYLRQLLREPLTVSYSEVSDKLLYNVKGELWPFGATELPLPQRLVAVRGIEPRFDG